MQRIKLTKSEKQVLRHLSAHGYKALRDFSQCEVDYALETLERKGLVRNGRVEGGDIECSKITQLGLSYIRLIPKLTNPIDWSGIIAIATLIVAILALFTGCTIALTN